MWFFKTSEYQFNFYSVQVIYLHITKLINAFQSLLNY